MRIPSITIIITKLLSDSLHHVCLIYYCLTLLHLFRCDSSFQMLVCFVSERSESQCQHV